MLLRHSSCRQWFLAGIIFYSLPSKVLGATDGPEKPFSDDTNYAEEMDAPPQGKAKEPAVVKERKAAKSSKSSSGSGWTGGGGGGRIGISPGIGFGSGYVSASLAVSYYFNRWIAIDTSGYYRDAKEDNDVRMIDFGPEVALKLLLPNPTLVTPFVGTGPGYQRWVIKKDDDIFDDSSSATGVAFAGIDIALSRHFAIEVMSKTTQYLQDPPRVYPDQGKFRPKTQNRVFIGFKVVI